jgi:hypothetical protein
MSVEHYAEFETDFEESEDFLSAWQRAAEYDEGDGGDDRSFPFASLSEAREEAEPSAD